ncbi:MAG: hypothetical protein DRQ55_20660 [Planctomycetota bacterium]|nr:MAG: hypothetical protein DRQ55_20660 [Planctomycetota bacterium]
MIFISDHSGVFVLEYLAHTFPNRLIGLPISTRGQGIAGSKVIFVLVRVPLADADSFNQITTDPVAFDR